MPKVLDNIRNNLITEAQKQIKNYGYAGMTVRSVAKACGIGIGTMYNYFKSKEELVHTVMYEDWLISVEKIRVCSEQTDHPKDILKCIYDEMLNFMHRHDCLISDPNAAKVFAVSYIEGHVFLREQVSVYLKKSCEIYAKGSSPLLPMFLAETLIVWTSAGTSFDDIYEILQDHFK
jgi:AcrR family transcriptional regulator